MNWIDQLIAKTKQPQQAVSTPASLLDAKTADKPGFFTPTPQLRVRDILRELPGAALKTGKEILRTPPRAALSTMASAFGQQEPFTATTPAQKFIAGTEPITPISRQAADIELSLKQKGGLAGKFATPLAVGATVGSNFLDLYLAGGGEGKLDKEAASLTLKELGIKAENFTEPTIKRLLKSGIDAKDINSLNKHSAVELADLLDKLPEGFDGAMKEDPNLRLLNNRFIQQTEKIKPPTKPPTILSTAKPTEVAGAKSPKDIVYKALGQRYKGEEIIANRAKAGIKFWEKQPIKTQVGFMDAVMQGKTDVLSDALKTKAEEYRTRLDKVYNDIVQHGELVYRENYFPAFWKKPEEIKNWFGQGILSRRPLEGTKSFRKVKVFEDISEGIKAGFQPLTTNPEKIVALAEENANKFTTARQLFEESKASNLLQFVKPGDKPPIGWQQIDDKIAKIYFPSEKGLVYAGQYYAQPELAKMVNNYLSRSAIRESNVGRAAIEIKNGLNAVQLGISGFHAGFEAINSMISKVGLGIGQIFTGSPLEGMKSLAEAPISPIKTYLEGRATIKKFFEGDAEATKVIDQVFESGMRITQNPIYTIRGEETIKESVKRGIEDFKNKQVWEGIKELAGVPKEAVEKVMYGMMKPLFQEYIPKLKVGAWMDLASAELERNAGRIAEGKITQAEVLRSVARNIDNRFGELNYDTLFFRNTTKDILQVGLRAAGWQIGTVRELGGAMVDVAKIPFGKGQGFTPKIQYAIGLITTLGVLDATYQYLHIGKKPQGIIDLIYPRNGLKDKYGGEQRVYLPTYAKDIKSVLTDPIKTVTNKLSPEVSEVFDLLRNQNYWGDAIRNPNDPFYKQFKEVVDYLGTTNLPFSIQQEQKIKQKKGTPEQKIETFLGVVPASSAQFAPPKVKAEKKFLQNMKYQSQKNIGLTGTDKIRAQQQLEQEIKKYLNTLPSEKEKQRIRFKLMFEGVSIKGTGKKTITYPTKK